MRLISYNGKYDMPYDLTCLTVEGTLINARNSITDSVYTMGRYKTNSEAKDALFDVIDAYCEGKKMYIFKGISE